MATNEEINHLIMVWFSLFFKEGGGGGGTHSWFCIFGELIDRGMLCIAECQATILSNSNIKMIIFNFSFTGVFLINDYFLI